MLSSTTALGIPELLEMVLDHATPQDLLLWQRVNKAWQAAIQRSPRIQERLFFRIGETCKTVSRKTVVFANPFLKFFAHESTEFRHNFLDDAFDGKASHPTASWRQMYMSSPATTGLDPHMMIGDRLDVGFWVECETGITIGQFADALKDHVALHRRAGEVSSILVCISPGWKMFAVSIFPPSP